MSERFQDGDRGGDGAPRLRLRLGARLKLLLLANIVPLAVLAWLGWRVWRGDGWRLAAGVDGGRLGLTLAVLVASCTVLALTAWILLPLGRWLRDYPRWCREHCSAALWTVPAGLGWLAWASIWVLAIAAAGAALALIVTGLWELLGQAHAAHQAERAGGHG